VEKLQHEISDNKSKLFGEKNQSETAKIKQIVGNSADLSH
jgi:hypothetical protein